MIETVKPHADKIMFEIMIPMYRLTEKDEKAFKDDPEGFIVDFLDTTKQNSYAANEVAASTRTLLTDLLCCLAGYSDSDPDLKAVFKPPYLEKLFNFVLKHFEEYALARQGGLDRDWKFKESLMFALATVAEEVMKCEEMNKQME